MIAFGFVHSPVRLPTAFHLPPREMSASARAIMTQAAEKLMKAAISAVRCRSAYVFISLQSIHKTTAANKHAAIEMHQATYLFDIGNSGGDSRQPHFSHT